MLFCVGKKPPTWGFMRTIYSYHISYQSHIMALQSYYIETTHGSPMDCSCYFVCQRLMDDSSTEHQLCNFIRNQKLSAIPGRV
jgi:hypothetical protein